MNISHFTAAEAEFFAEDTVVDIIPNFRGEQVVFITGAYGPFKPATTTSVPLWLALYFKRCSKCEICAPHWMNVEFL